LVADGKIFAHANPTQRNCNSPPACERALLHAMTTLAELEAKLLSALVTEENFVRAKSDLRLKNLIKNGRGSLEDCAVFLDDDGKTVLTLAFWQDDAKTVCSSFELGRSTTEDAFDANGWAARLMHGDG
jgi:hypothetical protein